MNVLFLTTLPTLKACNSPYMQYYFKRFFVLHSSEVIFSFLIKKSRQKAIEIETAFFIPLGMPRVSHWIISFMLHISAIISPTDWYLYRWVNWNISEVIIENSLSAFNYWDDFSDDVCRRASIMFEILGQKLTFSWSIQNMCTYVYYFVLPASISKEHSETRDNGTYQQLHASYFCCRESIQQPTGEGLLGYFLACM